VVSSGFNKIPGTSGQFELPYVWSSSDSSTYPTASTEYISEEFASGTSSAYLPNDVECYQFFSYEMNSNNALGSKKTDEISIDKDTGIITFENRNELTNDYERMIPDIGYAVHAKTTHLINILIVTTDGYNRNYGAGPPTDYGDSGLFLNP
jgi:hypothetical protein